VGAGAEYAHAHSIGFSEDLGLSRYDAVFGGYLADSLLKGVWVPKRTPGSFAQIVTPVTVDRAGRTRPLELASGPPFSGPILAEVSERRRAHLSHLGTLRPTSASEWFYLWPATMRSTMPNYFASRRLFRSYEPYMASDVVRAAATIPQEWKINRDVYQRAVRPFLHQTRWLPHAEGRLPYFPWWVNGFAELPARGARLARAATRRAPRIDGPWTDWEAMARSASWVALTDRLAADLGDRPFPGTTRALGDLARDGSLRFDVRRNVLQAGLVLTRAGWRDDP
ncbi:hypothetical protein PU560_10075, partial [Georgenia sp. 10Sc9-8]|nr:hypothetical protein [Georgenia halotolerans]